RDRKTADEWRALPQVRRATPIPTTAHHRSTRSPSPRSVQRAAARRPPPFAVRLEAPADADGPLRAPVGDLLKIAVSGTARLEIEYSSKALVRLRAFANSQRLRV